MRFIGPSGNEYFAPKNFLTYDDVLLMPQYSELSSRYHRDIDIMTELNPDKQKGERVVPIIPANMDTISGSEMSNVLLKENGDIRNHLTILHRFWKNDQEYLDQIRQLTNSPFGYSIGIGNGEKKLDDIVKFVGEANKILCDITCPSNVYVCIDIAHAHSWYVQQTIREIRKTHGYEFNIIAGNVATPEGALFLIEAGADIIKVGIGPGSLCTTRVVTGHGVPQLSAVMNIKRKLRDLDYSHPIIADGGIRYPGDVVKALAAGASAVMAGSIFSGCNETPGDVYRKTPYGGYTPWVKPVSYEPFIVPIDSGGLYKKYRGQASRDFMNSQQGKDHITPEGEMKYVPCSGKSYEQIMCEFLGGLRSGLTYSGAKSIEDLQKKARFLEISSSSMVENHSHGLL